MQGEHPDLLSEEAGIYGDGLSSSARWPKKLQPELCDFGSYCILSGWSDRLSPSRQGFERECSPRVDFKRTTLEPRNCGLVQPEESSKLSLSDTERLTGLFDRFHSRSICPRA